MSRPLATRLSESDWRALRDEYLDLLLLAGRISAGGVQGPRPADDAKAARPDSDPWRQFARSKFERVRNMLKVAEIAEAGPDVAEIEMIIVHFLDSAATRHGARWAPLHPERAQEYRRATRQDKFDLGKYLYERMEGLRQSEVKRSEEPTEILELVDRALKLGYAASYETKPDDLKDLRSKLADELRRRQLSTGAQAHQGEYALSPGLPRLLSRPRLPMALSPLLIAGAAALSLLLAGLSFQITLGLKERDLSRALTGLVSQFDKLSEATYPECRPEAREREKQR